MPIVDAAIPVVTNGTDSVCVRHVWGTALTPNAVVPTLSNWEGFVSQVVDGRQRHLAKGCFRGVFVKNPDGTEHIGQVTNSPLGLRALI